jgi:Tol biopolymer transport system component
LTPPDGGDASGLYVVQTAPAPSTPTPLLETAGTGRAVGELAWSPDGRQVLFTLPAAPGGPNTGGDLWQIASDGAERRVVAGAGAVGFPGARVDEIAPAPDGDAVAYTVVVPVENGVRFDSLWIKERSPAARALELAVPEGEAVVRLWWTAAGLVYQTVPAAEFGGDGGGSSFALYRAGLPGEHPVRLFAAGALAAGTPVGGATPELLGTPVPPAPPAGGTPPTG